jgi:hypothetical protein
MRKIVVLFLLSTCVTLAFSQQNNEPVYLSCYADYLCEFAETGYTIKEVMPYVKNGRLYFTSSAFPPENGHIRTGTNLIISDTDKSAISGVYIGSGTYSVDPGIPVLIAGIAESNKITITHIFTDWETGWNSFSKWAETINIAYY